ncbi:MAG TPA: hypothetical protein ENK91_16440, partial [Bacteroidetes bacterium]|nr:hypothetical protein [Bacteroidota bacterium]
MNDLSEKYEKIKRYLRGRLSKEEQDAFEAEIRQSQELGKEVEKVRLELDVVDYLLAEDLRKKFGHSSSPAVVEETPETLPKSFKKWIWWLLIPLLLLAFLLLKGIGKNKAPKQQITPLQKNIQVPKEPVANQPKTENPESSAIKRKKKKQVPKTDDKNFIALVENVYEAPEEIFGYSKAISSGKDSISIAVHLFQHSDYQGVIKLT